MPYRKRRGSKKGSKKVSRRASRRVSRKRHHRGYRRKSYDKGPFSYLCGGTSEVQNMLRKYPRSSATLLTLLGAGATATALRKAKAHATSEGIDNKYWVVEKPFKFLSGITPDLIKKTGANAYNDLVDFLKLPVDKPQASEQEAPVQVPVQAGVRASRPLG